MRAVVLLVAGALVGAALAELRPPLDRCVPVVEEALERSIKQALE